MINKLSNSHKLDGTNYDMWKGQIQYRLDNKDLLEHLIVDKFPLSDKDKDSKPIDTANVQFQEGTESMLYYVVLHAQRPDWRI